MTKETAYWRIGVPLVTGTVILSFLADLLKFHAVTVGWVAAVIMGIVCLFFHIELRNIFIKMYPITSKTFIRIGVPITGLVFLIIGLSSLIKIALG